jgi:hypothetical protein
MKKNLLLFTTVMLVLTLSINGMGATFITAPSNPIVPAKTSSTVESEKAKALIARLNEIKEMDKSSLSASEKKELRKETRSIKKQLKSASNGIYLSTAAIIIILLLVLLIVIL